MTRTWGLAARSLRMASRAWASAEAVTVHVLTTTMSAAAGVAADVKPRSSNCRSRAAPSACVARQPNCSMKKVGIETLRRLPNRDAIYRSSTRITALEARAKWQVDPCLPALGIRLYSPEVASLQSFGTHGLSAEEPNCAPRP